MTATIVDPSELPTAVNPAVHEEHEAERPLDFEIAARKVGKEGIVANEAGNIVGLVHPKAETDESRSAVDAVEAHIASAMQELDEAGLNEELSGLSDDEASDRLNDVFRVLVDGAGDATDKVDVTIAGLVQTSEGHNWAVINGKDKVVFLNHEDEEASHLDSDEFTLYEAVAGDRLIMINGGELPDEAMEPFADAILSTDEAPDTVADQMISILDTDGDREDAAVVIVDVKDASPARANNPRSPRNVLRRGANFIGRGIKAVAKFSPSLKETRAAYGKKAAAQRKLNSILESDPDYEAKKAEAEAEVDAAKMELRTKLGIATGVTAVSVAAGEAIIDKVGPDLLHGKFGTVAGAAAIGVGYPQFQKWREKKNISNDQRIERLAEANEAVAAYEAAAADDHDFENDAEYQELVRIREGYKATSWRDKLSTKYAELGAHGTVAAMDGIGFLQRAKQKLSNGYTQELSTVDWDTLEGDIVADRERLRQTIEQIKSDTPEDEWADSEDLANAEQALADYEAQIAEEHGETKRRLTKKGWIAVGAGALVVAGVGGYLAKYGFDNPLNGVGGGKKGRSGVTDQAQGGSGRPRGGGAGSDATNQAGSNGGGSGHSTSGNGSSSSSGAGTSHTTGGNSGSHANTNNGNSVDGPGTGSGTGGRRTQAEEWASNLTPSERRQAQRFFDGVETIKEQTGFTGEKLNERVEKTLRLAQKKDEFLGNTTGQARADRGRQFDEQFRHFVELSEQAK